MRQSPIGEFFFILALLSGSLGWKPVMIPELEELVINEGESLELKCLGGAAPLIFKYPHRDNGSINTDHIISQNEDENGNYIFIFRRPIALPGDTGWYGCAEEDADFPPKEGVDPQYAWIYVYVKSDHQFFVQETHDFQLIRVPVGSDTILPCRPTSPKLNVSLSSLYNPGPIGLNSTFDPKIGFTLFDLHVRDSDMYFCSSTCDDCNATKELMFHVTVIIGMVVEDLTISSTVPRYLIRGLNLRVNCSATLVFSALYVLKWHPPREETLRNDSRVSEKVYSVQLGKNSLRHFRELNIINLKDEDSGTYKCSIRTDTDLKEAQTDIEIHDPNQTFLFLTCKDKWRKRIVEIGAEIVWIVHVHAFPPPDLIWTHESGNKYTEIFPSNNTIYEVITDPEITSTTLKIKFATLRQSGNYTLEASNENKTETINFTLYVRSGPTHSLKGLKAYYAPKELLELRDEVESFPRSRVNWKYLNCPNYPSREGAFLEESLNWTATENPPVMLETKVNFMVKMSGILTCEACNEIDCELETAIILVSDGSSGFGVLEPEICITEGDDIEIICTASIYNYTNNLKWTIDEEELHLTDRVQVFSETTQFTYRSKLLISNLQTSDQLEYTCLGEHKDGRSERSYYQLKLSEPIAAEIIETNMNKTEVMFDLNVVGHKTIILRCFVKGTPKPKITWYKDDSVIERNDQYLLLHNQQELHIKYLVDTDSGKYMCQTENRFGKDETFLKFTVKGKEHSKAWIIAVIVLLIFCCLLTIYFCLKMRLERIIRKQLMEAGLMHFEEGALECLNPELTLDDQAELLPYDRKWEFPRDKLILGKQLGSGAFGVVRKAQACGIIDGEDITTVAVKMVRRATDPTYIRALASELKIMVHLGKHLNVVNLLGACTKNISKCELLVIVEYCHYGNLHNYLLRHRENFINQIDPVTGELDLNIGSDILNKTLSNDSKNRIKYAALSFSRSLSPNSDNTYPGTESVIYSQDSQGVSLATGDCTFSTDFSQPDWRTNYRGDYKDTNLKPICTQDLISWGFQVARGMEYLSERKVLHGDLAARNILLAENNVVKICDFGLAKTMYKDNNYKKKGDALLPIKWMAIESIRDRVFSTQSDVWSFGIVLWEFFTLAQTPYHGIDAETQYHKLIEGYRMEQPDYATRNVYNIMLRCWKAKPTLRPSFSELVDSIGDLLEESVKEHYMDLNTPYMDMNTMILEGKNDYLMMISAPDHTLISSPSHDYVNSPSLPSAGPGDSANLSMSPSAKDESLIFSPGPDFDHTHFELPSPKDNHSTPNSDSEDILESDPMLREENDPYLKPINVHEQRARFVKERQFMRDKPDEKINPDLKYCNTPSLRLVHNKKNDNDEEDAKEKFLPSIIKTQDNYVNMPQQKSDLMRDVPDGFSNPNYIFMNRNSNNESEV